MRASAPSRPICCQNRGASLHELLVYHLQVTAGTERLVYRPPIEFRLQKRLALLHALKGVFHSLAIVFGQAPGTAALQDTGDKADNQIPVRPCIVARRFLPLSRIPGRATAVLGRAGPGAADTDGLGFLRTALQELLDTGLMFPIITHVAEVGETILGAKPEPGKGYVGTLDMKFKRTVAHGMDVEVVEVDARPSPCSPARCRATRAALRIQEPAPASRS